MGSAELDMTAIALRLRATQAATLPPPSGQWSYELELQFECSVGLVAQRLSIPRLVA
eukprot:SAG11_NODE_11_length_27870_cov_16.327428_8_plen_57_part_00